VSVFRVAPELSDPVGPVEVGEPQDVEELAPGKDQANQRDAHRHSVSYSPSTS
jgi:hypothetical protein